METKKHNKIEKGYISLVQRTVETQMMAELMVDYGFPNAICRSLKEMFMTYFDTYIGTDKAEGQIIYRVIPEHVPPGIPVVQIKTLSVRLTIVDEKDVEIASKGMNELLKYRIVRITNEAYDQGGVLTQADLSIILGASLRTIIRRMNELREDGIIVPTRGNKKDIGPGVSHKAKITEMYLNGYNFTEIKRRTRHSSVSISRYLNDFARVTVLDDHEHTLDEIRIITGHSERLINEYLELKRALDTEAAKTRMNQLTARFNRGKKNNSRSTRTQARTENGRRIK